MALNVSADQSTFQSASTLPQAMCCGDFEVKKQESEFVNARNAAIATRSWIPKGNSSESYRAIIIVVHGVGKTGRCALFGRSWLQLFGGNLCQGSTAAAMTSSVLYSLPTAFSVLLSIKKDMERYSLRSSDSFCEWVR